MNIAIFGESSADESAMRILAEAALGSPINFVSPPIRSRGWPSVRTQLPTIIKYLHFRTNADGLIVVADSNSEPVSQVNEKGTRVPHSDSRLVKLTSVASTTLGALGSRPAGTGLRIAVGVAVPAIEAWYRFGIDAHVNEATWERGMQNGSCPYTKHGLKQDVYGTTFPQIAHETECAEAHARRLAENLESLERQFPIGFGLFVAELRNWRE